MKGDLGFRWLFFFTGLLVMGLGVALTIKGKWFGVGSWDVLHVGLFKQLGLSIGLWSIIMGILIVTSASIGLRKWPQIGTFANLAFVGLFIDLFNWIIPDPHMLLLKFIAFILGVILLAIGCGIYISADLGAGPRDTLMLLLSEKLNWSITFSRTFMEVVVAIIGVLLGGPIGIGTVIIAFALGPIIQISLRYSQKILHNIISKKEPAKYYAHEQF
ncbi:YitT family protein [Lentibacillus halophilus]|uniref:YitT family protein n=1 Tax=Lentibacillus halophilus TaxID=295065 RepID=A0ABP3J3X5_9BACI